jgi:hypothetical protein
MNDIFVYTPQIPTGDAGTRGHGTTRHVYVLRADLKTFKTRNSSHKVLKYFGTIRTDYGLKRGNSAKVLDAAEKFANTMRAKQTKKNN